MRSQARRAGKSSRTRGDSLFACNGAGLPQDPAKYSQRDFFGTRYHVVMSAFGGDGEAIERLDEVAPAFRRAFAASVPYCLNIKMRGARSPFTDWQIEENKR